MLRQSPFFMRLLMAKRGRRATRARRVKPTCPCKRLAMKAMKEMKVMKKEMVSMKKVMKSMSKQIDDLQLAVCVLQGIPVFPGLATSPEEEEEVEDGPASMNVYMTCRAGFPGGEEVIRMYIHVTDTVGDAKAKMAAELNIDRSRIILLDDNNASLADARTCIDCDIMDGSVVQVLVEDVALENGETTVPS
jgi:hypothetical protein